MKTPFKAEGNRLSQQTLIEFNPHISSYDIIRQRGTMLPLDEGGIGVRCPVGAKAFSLLYKVGTFTVKLQAKKKGSF